MADYNRSTLSGFKKSTFKSSLIFFLLFLLIDSRGYSQNYHSQTNKIFTYNILLNAVIGGVGGAINKKSNESIFKAFGKNFLIGSLGGLIKYTAKQETFSLRYEELSPYAKPNRLFFYFGQSMVNNASLNRSILHSYTMQLYGVNLDFQLKEKFSVKTKLSVLTLTSLCHFFANGDRFNLNRSLEYGLFYFDQNPKKDSKEGGEALYNAISIAVNSVSSYPMFNNIPHEIIHTYQFSDYFLISNIFYPKSFTKLKSLNTFKFIDKYFLIEVPYFGLFYLLQPKPVHYKNFYEFEAEHFSTRSYIPR
jgi:hypothetical protein